MKQTHQFLLTYDRKIKTDAEITLANLFSNILEIMSIL
jgi:hypothetical protein